VDISFGNKQLMSGAEIQLNYGHRYGLVGRNGIGKTTLLKMISRLVAFPNLNCFTFTNPMFSKQLIIPSNITFLSVEQEVEGDDTAVIDAVLASDTKRVHLLRTERELQEQINKWDYWASPQFHILKTQLARTSPTSKGRSYRPNWTAFTRSNRISSWTRLQPGQPQFSSAWASNRRNKENPQSRLLTLKYRYLYLFTDSENFPVVGECEWLWPERCSSNQICSSWTSQQTWYRNLHIIFGREMKKSRRFSVGHARRLLAREPFAGIFYLISKLANAFD
jgi:energy-coupling factor transporter ATP-binding protein EcfA2